MRWFVTNLRNAIYLFRGFLFVFRGLSFFNPFLYRQASCWGGMFLPGPWGTSGFAQEASKRLLPVIGISAAVPPLLPFSPPLSHWFYCSPVSFSPVRLWAAKMHGTTPGLSFRPSCFLLVRPRVSNVCGSVGSSFQKGQSCCRDPVQTCGKV